MVTPWNEGKKMNLWCLFSYIGFVSFAWHLFALNVAFLRVCVTVNMDKVRVRKWDSDNI